MFAKTKPAARRFDKQSLVSLPAALGRRFLITIDTEEEFDWDGPFERTGHTTVSVGKLQRFQTFVEKYGVQPIYFVDYSIVENDEAAEFLRTVVAAGTATVGVHLHPWVNPPFEEETNRFNSFAGNLPEELERAKILALRDAITAKTGRQPTIYRAGRYGVGPHTIGILRELGLTIDSSVRSRFNYSAEGGPDFEHIGSEPFWLTPEKDLLEVPLTTVFSGMFRKQGAMLLPFFNRFAWGNAVLSRTKMLERIPLTPEGISAREAKEAIDVALDDQLQMLVFSFHSPSLSAGHTPYVRTSADLDRFYDWWREIVEHLIASDVAPLTVPELEQATGLAVA